MNFKMMKELLTVQDPVDTPDGGGGVVRTWRSRFSIHARVQPVDANEQLITEGKQHVISHRVITRYDRRLTPKQRYILGGGRILNVESLMDRKEEHRYMEANCLEQDE